MVDERVTQRSSTIDQTEGNGEVEAEVSHSFPLSIEQDRNSRKIKWLGSFDELKAFAKEELKLSDEWASVPTNGGFFVLKAKNVTVSFYPNTKTLNVQGAKHEAIKKKLVSLVPQEEESNANANNEEQDGGEREQSLEIVEESSEDEDEGQTSGDDDYVDFESTVPVEPSVLSCIGCKANTSAIAELKQKFAILEQFHRVDCSPSYEELLLRIKTLEEERDSLVTALRLMTEESRKEPQASPAKCRQNEDEDQSQMAGRSLQKKRKESVDTNETTRKPSRKPARKSDNGKSGGKSERNQSSSRQNTPAEVILIGDSMTRNIIGNKLSSDRNVNSFSFPGATIEDMVDYAKPISRRKPKTIILHVGTNNLKADRPKQIKQKIVNLVDNIKSEHTSVQIAVSSVVHRKDQQSLNDKIDQVNSLLASCCQQKNWDFISNNNIGEDCLNRSGLHLNRRGVYHLVSNLRDYINEN